MKRFSHIQRFRSLVLVALAVLWAVFMMIPSAAVIAEKGGKGKPNDTSGTTPTGDTSGTTPTGDTSGGDTGGTTLKDTSDTTPTGDTSNTTTPTGDTSGGDTSNTTTPTGDTSGGDTSNTTTPTGDTSGTTPTGDTSGELDLPHSDEYLCLNFGLNCSLSPARDTGWSLTDYYTYCLSWELEPFTDECPDPMGGYS